MLAIVATLGAALILTGEITDINDVFIHVLLGEQILDGVSFSDLGSQFSFTVDNPDWRSGAWVSEALMALVYRTGDWVGLVVVFRVGCLLAIAAILFWGVIRRYPSRAAVPAFLIAMAACAMDVQERPQSISYVFIALLGVGAIRNLEDNRVIPWWLAGISACVWANFHGLWILLPATLFLLAIGHYADSGIQDQAAKRCVFGALAATVGGCLTPLGIQGLTLPFELRSAAAGAINEWQSTVLLDWHGLPLLLMIGLSLTAAGRVRAKRSEWIFLLPVLASGLMAARNVTPAILLLTPLLASLLTRVLGANAKTTVSALEATRLRVAAVALILIGLVALPMTVWARDSGPGDALPTELVAKLDTESGPVLLLNDYNLSGVALFYGGDRVQVAVDGRADYYGADFVNEYVDATVRGRDLESFLASMEPTHALIGEDSALADELVDSGWARVSASDGFVLLDAGEPDQ